MKEISTEDLKHELAMRGYPTENLWHIDDVLDRYKCSQADAMDIIERALEHKGVKEYIFDTIDEVCWNDGIKQKRS